MLFLMAAIGRVAVQPCRRFHHPSRSPSRVPCEASSSRKQLVEFCVARDVRTAPLRDCHAEVLDLHDSLD